MFFMFALCDCAAIWRFNKWWWW